MRGKRVKSKIDDLDRPIVRLLMNDARMSSAEIARSLGNVSAQTVGRRIRRLTRSGIIKITPDPRALGYLTVADIFIDAEPGNVRQVAETLSRMEELYYVALSTGDCDVSAAMVVAGIQDLQALVDKPHSMPGVARTRTFLITRTLKSIYEWEIPANLP